MVNDRLEDAKYMLKIAEDLASNATSKALNEIEDKRSYLAKESEINVVSDVYNDWREKYYDYKKDIRMLEKLDRFAEKSANEGNNKAVAKVLKEGLVNDFITRELTEFSKNLTPTVQETIKRVFESSELIDSDKIHGEFLSHSKKELSSIEELSGNICNARTR